MISKGGFLSSEPLSESHLNNEVQNNKFLGTGIKLCRCTIKLLNDADIQDGKIIIKSNILNYIQILCCIRNVRQSSNSLELVVEDGTGSINMRIFQDKYPSFELRNGTWIKAIGKINQGPGGVLMIAQKVDILIDFNQMIFHYLEIVEKFSSSATERPNTSINELILNYFDNVNDDVNGIHIEDVFKAFPNYSMDAIKSSASFLLNEGHLYTTIDENHLRSVNKGL